MNKEERQKLLEELSKLSYARALEDLLDEEMAKIDTVDNITSLEEAIGRQRAKETINRVFAFLIKRNPQGVKKKTSYT